MEYSCWRVEIMWRQCLDQSIGRSCGLWRVRPRPCLREAAAALRKLLTVLQPRLLTQWNLTSAGCPAKARSAALREHSGSFVTTYPGAEALCKSSAPQALKKRSLICQRRALRGMVEGGDSGDQGPATVAAKVPLSPWWKSTVPKTVDHCPSDKRTSAMPCTAVRK
jgi:hypothetical protein